VQAARLDAEARLRAEVRSVIADLRRYGCPDFLLKGKCLAELWELRDSAARQLMGAPGRAA
jgi:hypothetical protein